MDSTVDAMIIFEYMYVWKLPILLVLTDKEEGREERKGGRDR